MKKLLAFALIGGLAALGCSTETAPKKASGSSSSSSSSSGATHSTAPGKMESAPPKMDNKDKMEGKDHKDATPPKKDGDKKDGDKKN